MRILGIIYLYVIYFTYTVGKMNTNITSLLFLSIAIATSFAPCPATGKVSLSNTYALL